MLDKCIDSTEVEFSIDSRILSSSFELGDWPLSRVFLKNNADYPWFILVPRVANITEIDELDVLSRHQLMDEINQLSLIVRGYFTPHKLNVAYLGNIVNQLHIHIVARFKHDKLWPHGIWQASLENVPYEEDIGLRLCREIGMEIDKFC